MESIEIAQLGNTYITAMVVRNMVILHTAKTSQIFPSSSVTKNESEAVHIKLTIGINKNT